MTNDEALKVIENEIQELTYNIHLQLLEEYYEKYGIVVSEGLCEED